MRYIYLILIFINLTHANEFQKKHLNKEQIKFIKNHPTIVASNEKHWAPYDYNENGVAKGYSVEYLKLIAKKIGISITFKTDTWTNLVKKIKNKEIDLIHPLTINEDRKKYLEFTQSLFKNDMVVVTNSSNENIKSFEDLKGKRLAVVKGWNSTKIYKEHFPLIIYKEYDSSLDMLKAVAFGEADATIDGFLTVNYLKQKHLLTNLHITKRIDVPNLDQKLYIGVRKDWKILTEIINIAINNITSDELVSLNTKWMTDHKNKIIFSKEELDFLDTQKKFTLCVSPDWFPYEKIQNNKHIGITFDYFEEFRKSIPVPIEFIPTKTWTQSINLVKDKKCDILSLAASTPSRDGYLNFTKPYLNLPLVIATKLEKPFISKLEDILDHKLGVIKGSHYIEFLKNRYPNIKLVEMDSIKDAFEKVISGEIYGFIDTLTVIGYQVQNNYLGIVKISGKLNENQKIGSAIRKDMPLLIPIFNKAIDNISEQKHREILNKWVLVKYEDKFNYTYLFIALGILALIILFILYRQYILNRQNKLLVESIDEFEHLLNSTIEAIFILENGKCIDSNLEAVKLLGFKNKQEVIGLDMLDVVEKKYHEILLKKTKQDSSEPYEVTILNKDGTKIPVLVRGRTFIRRNKKIRVSAIIDLTQLKNNEKLLIEQSKMVALGEMLENIAHQWRQPLSVISTAASGVKIQKEYGILKDEEFFSSMDGIIENTNYLSKTIDDFRNFILAEKVKNSFDLKEHLEKDLSILLSMTKINNIEVITDMKENITLDTYESELTQAIINIVNNAKDQFIKDKIEDRYLFIKTSSSDGKAIITIKDNANGIKEDIIGKIFEPYFTTKHKTIGTGLGLYMTRKIIDESLKGSIKVENTTYKHNNFIYTGAEFTIELSLA